MCFVCEIYYIYDFLYYHSTNNLYFTRVFFALPALDFSVVRSACRAASEPSVICGPACVFGLVLYVSMTHGSQLSLSFAVLLFRFLGSAPLFYLQPLGLVKQSDPFIFLVQVAVSVLQVGEMF